MRTNVGLILIECCLLVVRLTLVRQLLTVLFYLVLYNCGLTKEHLI